MGQMRTPGQVGYLLASEVTNLRLAVELASSAMRLGRWHEAYEHLMEVDAPGRRRHDKAKGLPISAGRRMGYATPLVVREVPLRKIVTRRTL